MGARASVSFKDQYGEGVILCSHWGGTEFHETAKKYMKEVIKAIKAEVISPTWPLGRLEARTLTMDFIRYITKDLSRVESDLYIGKDQSEVDNSDYGHLTIDVNDYAEQHEFASPTIR